MTTDNQPTVEQSLHSLALSMIQINDELKKTRRIQTETLRFMKREARQTIVPWNQSRKKPSLWARFWEFSWGTWA